MTNEYDLMVALKERGHTEEQINAMTPREKFVEFCEWHGLGGWANILISAYKEAHKEETQPA